MKHILTFCVPLILFTSFCDQEYTFMGATSGYNSSSIWILEEVGGECGYTDLQEIILVGDEKGKRAVNYSSGDTVAIRRFLNEHLHSRTSVRLTKDDKNVFSGCTSLKFTLRTPVDNKRLREKFNHFGDRASDWNAMMGDSGVVAPDFTGIKASLVYASPDGLYVGYKITEVWLVSTDVIVIFTQHDQRGIGENTLHGYLIYELSKPE